MNLPALRVCLVENHADTRDLLILLLQQQGHVVEFASTCAGARKLLAESRFDVLLSDIGLADGSGWSLLAELEPEDRPGYAIAMSGFGALSDREKSIAAGFRHHLVKPLDLRGLNEVLCQAREEAAAGRRPALS